MTIVVLVLLLLSWPGIPMSHSYPAPMIQASPERGDDPPAQAAAVFVQPQITPTLTLWSVSARDSLLRTVDPATGATLTTTPMVMADMRLIDGANGLAYDVASDQLYAVLRVINAGSGTSRELVILDPLTGVATSIGPLGDNFAAIAFDCNGTLYGLTGDGAREMESVFIINKQTAAITLLTPLGLGDDGEALAFHPPDGLLYHASGHFGAFNPFINDGVIFEKFDPARPPFTRLPYDPVLANGEVRALGFDPVQNAFLWSHASPSDSPPHPLYRVSLTGTATLLGATDHVVKGLAFSGVTLFSVSSRDALLRTLNPSNGDTLTSVPITIPGLTVNNAQGLAVHPSNGMMYAVLTVAQEQARILATVNPATGAAVRIGNLGVNANGLTFDLQGNLYATTGFVGAGYLSLLQVDPSTAEVTPLYTLERRSSPPGRGLTFNPNDGLLYTATGEDIDDLLFEAIDVQALPVFIPIEETALIDEEAQALVHYPAMNAFLWKQDHGPGPLFLVSPDASVVTFLGNMDHQAKGLAFTGPGASACSVNLNPASLAFGNVEVGVTSPAMNIIVSNLANTPAAISSISITGANAADFAQTNNCPSSLAAGASCTAGVTFTPGAIGTRAATFSVASDSPGSPHTAALSGTGTSPAPSGPVVNLDPTSLAFGNVNVGSTSAAMNITVSNTGDAPATISSISITGANAADFAQTNNCPPSLAAGANCTAGVTFSPGAIGTRTATFNVASNAPGSPHTAALSGSGVDFALNPAPGTPTSQTIVTGETVQFQVLVDVPGGPTPVTLSCSTNAPASLCRMKPSSVTPSAGNPAMAVAEVETTSCVMAPPGWRWPEVPPLDIRLLLACTLLLILLGVVAGRRLPQPRRAALALVLLLAWSGLAAGCSGSVDRFTSGTVPGTYNVTVTASSGGANRTQVFSFTVVLPPAR